MISESPLNKMVPLTEDHGGGWVGGWGGGGGGAVSSRTNNNMYCLISASGIYVYQIISLDIPIQVILLEVWHLWFCCHLGPHGDDLIGSYCYAYLPTYLIPTFFRILFCSRRCGCDFKFQFRTQIGDSYIGYSSKHYPGMNGRGSN